MENDKRFYEAVRLGVSDAMWRMITSVTDMPGSDFYATVEKAVRDGIYSAAMAGAFSTDELDS